MVVTQPIMQAHEDLAALFSRNLILDASKIQQIQIQEQPQQEAPEPQPITYSISQHYHHSVYHVAPVAAQPDRPASEPPQSEHQGVEAILTSHGVDPATLSQSQVQLFKEADDAQKLRLLELWRICPPTATHNSNPALAHNSTSLEQEEQLARMRYEEQQQMDDAMAMSMDGTSVMVPIQGGDGRWQVPEAAQDYMMEPYMSSGYEELARSAMPMAYKPATDPVYKSACLPIDYRSAHMPIDWALRQQKMENDYGAFAQCRMEY
ncbi:hypothetical protein MCOR27_011321 [Pyricularia oryzae]|uniref:Uncharacterized protein n=5 Tax=Pyricularia TaxID=48558 RepID=A0ABQ8NJR5_PYRGI|nr:uncharacterized protein MGG_07717 [Pyricularia oryzae 70-15]KAH8848305.1 hypothetical protein MCOR01_001682 [Pyricularia oryzae]KAI6298167.1 hypothetical protein MCOR33_005626 [Pyricularia grisea]EHA53113.1 hypothetical protein MGG_07717 [Pyricularia oryzae 70-15]KAH9429750.1 hypothetical protein MCOR02_009487 [Pyricularia oryzae]KAI6263056.1 hypothetical protein MCOR19_000696 [Pyricularia oryzae]